MADRYFVSQTIQGERVTLVDSEAHHLARVMRAQPGTEVILFDGTGGEYPARVEQVTRHEVILSVGGRVEIDREPAVRVTLGVALPKGDRQRWLIEKGVDLGVARLVPIETKRGVAQPAANTLDRLERAVIEAAKQCGRNRLMEIAPPRSWQEFVATAPSDCTRWVAHPASAVNTTSAATVSQSDIHQLPAKPATIEIWLAIGPEGGLTDEEIQQALASGWHAVDLGPRILRVETAALALAAYCLLGSG